MDNSTSPDTADHSFCAVALPDTVYAGPATKKEFDEIALPERIHDWAPSDVVTVIKSDGKQWERQCHSKVLEGGPVTVIFQWFNERPIEADEG